jgi:hypothetical protein
MYELGKVYYFMALQKKNKIEKDQLLSKSVDYLQKSVVIYQKNTFLADLQLSYQYLANVIEEQADYEKPLYYLEKSKKLKGLIFSLENMNQISNIKSEKAIELRNKKIEIRDLKIKNKSRQIYLLITVSLTTLILLTVLMWFYRNKKKQIKT